MDKRSIIHFIKTLVFCNGIASAICSVLIIMFMMLSGRREYITVTGIAYTVMAIYAGRLAAKGLPVSMISRYLPAVIPAAVTLIVWTVCYAGNGLFSIYAVSQATHFAVITICKATGAYLPAFLLPLSFNLMFLVSFTAFERTSKERIRMDESKIQHINEI
ncbi:MAG: hypothetical protein ACYCWE_01780 [Eubacteriales bacterium]